MRGTYSVSYIKCIVLVMVSIFLVGISNHQITYAQQQQPSTNFTSAEQQLLLSGISFQIDNVSFTHHTATVNGIQLHYVMGGKGDPIVLLHGYPQSWYEWRYVMPDLANNYTVIAPDLRGFGDSSKPMAGYDGKTIAEDIYQLITQLGFNKIFMVAHDVGSQPAFSYTAEHPDNVTKLVIMDFPILVFYLQPLVRMGRGGFHFIKHVIYRKFSSKVKKENIFQRS